MELSNEFMLRTVLLLTPGLVGCKMLRAFVGRAYDSIAEALVDALLLSTLAYVVVALALRQSAAASVTFLYDTRATVSLGAVGAATVAVVPIAAAWTALDSRSALSRFAVQFRLTNRVSPDDVWTFLLDRSDHEWHFVRDHARDLLYFGHIAAWSDSGKQRELWLSSVKVYTADARSLLYETDDLYWCGRAGDVTIEAPSQETDHA